MSTILIKNISYLVVEPDFLLQYKGNEPINPNILRNKSIFIRDNIIEKIGELNEITNKADQEIDASGKIVLPGFINTHHHMVQTLFRGSRLLKQKSMKEWLQNMCRLSCKLDYEAAYISAMTAMAELILSGCTTTADQLYVYPKNNRGDHQNDLFDATINAARDIGIRFHPCRGSISPPSEDKGDWADELIQSNEEIISESKRVVEKFHDNSKYSMCRVSLGPCTPYTATPELYKETIKLARELNIQCHTHIAETQWEVDYCKNKYGLSSVEYMRSLGWLGPDVWFAHAIFLADAELEMLKNTNTGVSHCPIANMPKKQVAKVKQMLDKGINVSIGVDGSAGNDSSDMLFELRIARTLQGMNLESAYLSAETALKLGTINGARVLGREDALGSLVPGKAADIIMYDLNKIGFAGCIDPINALFYCSSYYVDTSIINGKVIVKNGVLVTQDLQKIINIQNDIAKRLV